MTKHHNITEDAFSFIKYRCGYCGKLMKTNKNFCSVNCKILYFEKINKLKNKIKINKKTQSKRRVFGLQDILNKEDLKAIIKKTERNIDKRMNKSIK